MDIIGFLSLGVYFALLLFLVVLAWRFVRAHEDLARHSLEIARDLKIMAHKMPENPAEPKTRIFP